MRDFFFVFISTQGCFSQTVTVSLDLQHKNKVYEVVIWICIVAYPLGRKEKKGRKTLGGLFISYN